MKQILKYSLFVIVLTMCYRCTDVIHVDVPSMTPKLVIEASIDCEEKQDNKIQHIRLSTTQDYFTPKNQKSPVKGASVQIQNIRTGEKFIFEDQQDGTYKTLSFHPIIENTYKLTVVYKNETYEAIEKLMPPVPIKTIDETKEQGWSNEEDLKVKITFQDPVNTTNYYLIKYQRQGDDIPYILNLEDEFINGKEVPVYCDQENEDSPYKKGDVVDVALYNISKNYYWYVKLLAEQIRSGQGGNMYSPPPTQLKSNCKNITNANNYALGYFRLTTVAKKSWTFQDK